MNKEQIKALETKLNKEYENFGIISIREILEKGIALSEIEYVKSIMDIAEPLNLEEPIIVSRTWKNDRYILIDGYHRLKSSILEGRQNIKAIILEEYEIKRNSDTLFEFLEKLKGSTIKFLSSEVIIVDGKTYEIKSNEGCGGCSSGWSSIKIVKDFIGKDIKITTIEAKYSEVDGDEYKLVINGEVVADVDSGYGNGYYGGDFEVYLRN